MRLIRRTMRSGKNVARLLVSAMLLAILPLVVGVAAHTHPVRAGSQGGNGVPSDCTSTPAAGGHHSLEVRFDGTLWASGRNVWGQLGLGNTSDRYGLTQVGSDTDWMTVACGYYHSLGLRSDGSLWAWGLNASGQLGLDDTTGRYLPTLVGSDTNWKAVAAGFYHSLGLRHDGTLWAWGGNNDGQLGLGDTVQRVSPTQVGSDTNWMAVACGEYYSLGLRSDGTLWAWGYGVGGVLGLGSNASRMIPTQVGSDTNWKAVAAGLFSLGLRQDGTLWAWGRNVEGQLGLGDDPHAEYVQVPTQVGSDTNWKAVDGGWGHSLGLRSDGTLWAWGYNKEGELGLGDTTPRHTPTQVGSDTNWRAVACGRNHSLASRSDESLWAWGANDNGQLGLPSSVSGAHQPTPTSPRILSCDSTGDAREQFAASQDVYVKGTGLKPDTIYRIWIQDDAVAEGGELVAGEDPSGLQEEVTTDANGDFGPIQIWSVPSDHSVSYHEYDIVMDRQGDGQNTGRYNSPSDGIDSLAAVGFTAPVPEVATLALFGGGLLLVGGMVIWTKRRAGAQHQSEDRRLPTGWTEVHPFSLRQKVSTFLPTDSSE